MIEVTIPLRLKTPLNSREHWRKVWRRGEQEKTIVHLVLSPWRTKIPPRPRVVTLTRISSGTYDGDSLWACFKHVRDTVARFMGVDDRESPDLEWRYAQEVGPRGRPAIRIRVDHNPKGV